MTSRTPSRARLWMLVVPIIGMIIASNVGAYTSPSLVKHHPLVLIMLNSQNRYLLAASVGLSFWPFVIVGTLRLLLPDPFFFYLGRGWGGAALAWAKRQAGVKDTVVLFEKLFHKARYPAVVIAPNNFICPLAGEDGMDVRIFLFLDVLGTIGRVLLLWWAGEAFKRPITSVVNFLSRYQWWFIIGAVVVVALQATASRKSGKPRGPALQEFDDVDGG
jgi:membrane protein DedA with SNARE-associated domain